MSGGVLPQIDMSRVASYLERLARDQNNMQHSFEMLDYRDVLALRDAVLDFFKMGSADFTSAPTFSSSSSDGALSSSST